MFQEFEVAAGKNEPTTSPPRSHSGRDVTLTLTSGRPGGTSQPRPVSFQKAERLTLFQSLRPAFFFLFTYVNKYGIFDKSNKYYRSNRSDTVWVYCYLFTVYCYLTTYSPYKTYYLLHW